MHINISLPTLRKTLVAMIVMSVASTCLLATVHAQDAEAGFDPTVIPMRDRPVLSKIIADLDEHRVVLVGETHTRYDHHLVQLKVLQEMHRRHPDLAIGVEWFQFPFQRHLDDYLNGTTSVVDMLERTGYFDRWRYDYRLYRPIMEYARDNRIPVVALNAPKELTRQIGKVGISNLAEKFKSQLPRDYDRSDKVYEQRLRETFDMHPNNEQKFENFLDVMLTWDETMAQRASDYLKQHPGRRMVIFAGSGHVNNAGIPARLKRQSELTTATLMVGIEASSDPQAADYLVLSQQQDLPPPALLGAFLEPGADGLYVLGLSEDSAIGDAGIEKGDVLLSVDGESMSSFAAVKVALIDHAPGDQVEVRYRRKSWIGKDDERAITVTLGGPAQTRAHP